MITTKAELEELFLRKKPVRLLMALKIGGPTKYISVLSKETDCTYSHTVKLLEEFKRLGLVDFEKAGRVKFITLTTDGQELAGNFEGVLRKFSRLKIPGTGAMVAPAKTGKK
jgi:DNA-binding MarR family transcriptional regulator